MVSCYLGAELFLGFPAPSLTSRCHLSRPALTTHFLVFFLFFLACEIFVPSHPLPPQTWERGSEQKKKKGRPRAWGWEIDGEWADCLLGSRKSHSENTHLNDFQSARGSHLSSYWGRKSPFSNPGFDWLISNSLNISHRRLSPISHNDRPLHFQAVFYIYFRFAHNGQKISLQSKAFLQQCMVSLGPNSSAVIHGKWEFPKRIFGLGEGPAPQIQTENFPLLDQYLS